MSDLENAIEGTNDNASVIPSARIEELRKRFDARLRHEGVYLTDTHLGSINDALNKLDECRLITLTSENFAIARYYKELCVNRFRANSSVKVLCFDPLSGPDLLSVLNEQLAGLGLDEVSTQTREVLSAKRAMLIIDNEDLVTTADWELIASLTSQLLGANIGVLCLLPRDARSSSPLLTSASVRRIEFLPPTERELHYLLVFAEHSASGSELLRLLESLGLSTTQSTDLSDEAQYATMEEAEQMPSKGADHASEESEHAVRSSAAHDANAVSHLSFRLFIALAIVELLGYGVYRLF